MSGAAAAVAPSASEQRPDIDLIQPFILALVDYINIQYSMPVRAGNPYLKGAGAELTKDCCALFGVLGDSASALVSVCFPTPVLLQLMGNLFGEKYETVTPEVEDGLMELVNVVFGQVKKKVNEKGMLVNRVIPSVVVGSAMRFKYLTSGKSVIVPFEMSLGTFHLEITLEPKTL